MTKGGLIMDVVNAEQAKIAEQSGVSFRALIYNSHSKDSERHRRYVKHFIFIKACAVMALERVPADIRKSGGVARMSDPKVYFHIMI